MPSRRSTNILPTTSISSSNSLSRRRRPAQPPRDLPLTPSTPPSTSLPTSSDRSSGPSNTAGEAWSPPPNQTPANPNSPSPLPGSSSTDPTLSTTATAMVRATPSVKKSHARQRPEGHIPRPKNPFILFRSYMLATGQLEVPSNDNRKVSQLAGKLWTNLDQSEKDRWIEQARTERDEHYRKYPDYKYAPAPILNTFSIDPTRARRGRPMGSFKRVAAHESDNEVESDDGPMDPDFEPSARRAKAVNTRHSRGKTSFNPGQLTIGQQTVNNASRRRSSSTPATHRPSQQISQAHSVNDQVPGTSSLGRRRGRVVKESLVASKGALPDAVLDQSPIASTSATSHPFSRFGPGGLPLMDDFASTSAAVYSTASTPGQLPSQYLPPFDEPSQESFDQHPFTFGGPDVFSVKDSTNWDGYFLSTEAFLPGMTYLDRSAMSMEQANHELPYNTAFDFTSTSMALCLNSPASSSSTAMHFNSPVSSSSASPPGLMHAISPFSSPLQQVLAQPGSYHVDPLDQTLFPSLPGPSHPRSKAEDAGDLRSYYRGGADIFDDDDYLPYPY